MQILTSPQPTLFSRSLRAERHTGKKRKKKKPIPPRSRGNPGFGKKKNSRFKQNEQKSENSFSATKFLQKFIGGLDRLYLTLKIYKEMAYYLSFALVDVLSLLAGGAAYREKKERKNPTTIAVLARLPA